MDPDASNSERDGSGGLKLVDESSRFSTPPTPTAAETSTPDGDSSGRRGLPIWLFVVTLLAFVLVAGWQARVAGELEAEVERIEAELLRSNALLDAHRTHLSEIRGGVHELSARLDGLRDLVDSDPSDPSDPSDRSESAAAEGVGPDGLLEGGSAPWAASP
jgi:hypothetical protein